MKKFLVLSCLFSLGLIAQSKDAIHDNLSRAAQGLKECVYADNRFDSECFKKWSSLANSIFATEMSQNHYLESASQVSQREKINNDYFQAVQRRFTQYGESKCAGNKNIGLVKTEFCQGLDVALNERRNAILAAKSNQVENDRRLATKLQNEEIVASIYDQALPGQPIEVIIVETPCYPIWAFFAWCFGADK